MPPTQFTLILPLYVGGHTRILKDGSQIKPNKKYWLNLNQYRNWHYRTAGTTKKLFKEAIAPQILALPDMTGLWGRVHLHYAMYSPSHQKRDLMNAVSIIDKYFSDALVELGKLSDDDLHTITSLSCKVESVDKANPRMEVTITP